MAVFVRPWGRCSDWGLQLPKVLLIRCKSLDYKQFWPDGAGTMLDETSMLQNFRALLPLVILTLSFAWGTPTRAQDAPKDPKEVRFKWDQKYYSKINGKPALVFAREMRNSRVAFADIDGDGDQDIFMGQANGKLAYFENQGNDKKPNFVMITQEYKAIFEQRRQDRKVKVWNTIDIGERSAPALVDIDFDGDLDLFIGSAAGNIWYFENIGNNLIPVFQLATAKFEGIMVGRDSVPVFADVNLQRKFDLLVGTVEGRVLLFVNQGTRRKPDFKNTKPTTVVEMSLETHASPGLTDWDGDGDLDLIVGMKNGTLNLYENIGDRFFPDWKLKTENFLLIDVGGESSPTFVDIDADGDDDMVVGGASPIVSLFENRVQGDKRILWNISTNLFNFNKLVVTGQRASMAAGDLDADGDLDFIVGERNGNLNYWRNDGAKNDPDLSLVTEELLFITGMENSAPTLGDIDGDGDLDLLVGDKQGLIAFIENIGTNKAPKWTLKDKTYFQIDVGSNSVPRLVDIDEDGDLDLLVGNFSGRVILYLNKGTKNSPVFAIDSTRFASAKVEKNSVPDLFDWNRDKFADLVLGGEDGKLLTYFSPGKNGKDQLNWESSEKAMGQFDVEFLSHPYLTDYNGDNAPDLLIGNDEGDFLLYLNGGIDNSADDLQVVVDNSIDQKSGSLVVESVEGPIELDIAEVSGEGGQVVEEDKPFGSFMNDDGPQILVSDPKFSKISTLLIKNREIQKSSPTLGDLDNDGDLDLLVGSKSGKVYYYQNQGSDTHFNFVLLNEDYLKTGGAIANSTPLLVDLDQDGDLDIVVGSTLGRLSFYLNQGSTEEPNFVLDKDYFKNLWLGQNARPAVMDLNGDSILDLLVGTLNGRVTFVSNESNRFLIQRRDYQRLDVGIGSTPAFADLNNDGIPDLMIGSDIGKVHFYKNDSQDLTGLWKEQENTAADIEFPKGTCPTAVDLDHDGDLDLITGTDVGMVLMYRNDAILLEQKADEAQPTTIEE